MDRGRDPLKAVEKKKSGGRPVSITKFWASRSDGFCFDRDPVFGVFVGAGCAKGLAREFLGRRCVGQKSGIATRGVVNRRWPIVRKGAFRGNLLRPPGQGLHSPVTFRWLTKPKATGGWPPSLGSARSPGLLQRGDGSCAAAAFDAERGPLVSRGLRRCWCAASVGGGNRTAQANSWSRRRWWSKAGLSRVVMRSAAATGEEFGVSRDPVSNKTFPGRRLHRLESGPNTIRPGWSLAGFVPAIDATPAHLGKPPHQPGSGPPGHAGWRSPSSRGFIGRYSTTSIKRAPPASARDAKRLDGWCAGSASARS